MPSALSIKFGDLLYKNAFPIYNLIYPVFKNFQDKEEIALLKKYIKKGDTVLDIGANIGFYTKILSGLVGDSGKVYAFEPDKTNFKHLRDNTALLKNVVLNNTAVSDKTGIITLYKSTLLNVDHKTYATDSFSEKTEIPCVSMDELLPAAKVDFIKIDIQGYEYFAFKGMQYILKNNHGIKILSEFFPYGIKKSGITTPEFLLMFHRLGFKVSLLENGNMEAITPQRLAALEALDEHHYFNIFITR